ncbi:MAG TPA: GH116 family glycosyl-hydrolase, partial [Anaerolineaceae bacterium]
MTTREQFTYRGNQTHEISFPLGGIGTGSIGLAGNGRLIDWEIFNRPNKGSLNGFSHFAVKVERDGQVIDARVLQGDLHPPYSGSFTAPQFSSFGFGPDRQNMAGLPHFTSVEFTGEFPLARLAYHHASFPGSVEMLAFNPFIPLNAFDSGIPAAFFEIQVTNTTSEPLTYQLTGALGDPLPGNNIHTLYDEGSRAYLHMRTDGAAADDKTQLTAQGNLTLAVDGGDAPSLESQAFWFRGAWFDSLEVYWREQMTPGGLKPRSYSREQSGANNTGCLAARFALAPGQSRRVRFIIAWDFPVVENYWNADSNHAAAKKGLPIRWKNYYATRFENSFSSAQYALENWERLYAETLRFKEALFSSTLDPVVIDAVSANLAVLKSAAVLRLEDGVFYGFEGCHSNAGCCEGSCTHVWNYAQAAPFLFPELERSMRGTDFRLNQREDGGMRFRLPLPDAISAEDYWVFHPCADGQFGNVLKAYADWKISGDTTWLAGQWPAIQKAIAFAWAPTNEYRWDPQKSGVLTGRMHHTLDMELFGPSAWLNGFYLAALKAGAEIALALGDLEKAGEYQAIFNRGQAWTAANLFNGEYFIQRVDLGDRDQPEQYGVTDVYWDAEHGEIKYQIGEGCEIDQLLAQWHANLYGLGAIFDPQQTRTALKSLFKYNYKQPMRDFYNPCRIFALNDEAGLVMCAWPPHVRKPMIPIPYSQEVFTGTEYAAASLMIQSGLVDEGLTVVRSIRERYDGEKRNPWNEIECGSNYARSMASYALLQSFSGFSFDLSQNRIGFNPLIATDGRFQVFWSLGTGWGIYRQSPERVEIEVLYGALEIQRLALPFLKNGITSAALDGLALS